VNCCYKDVSKITSMKFRKNVLERLILFLKYISNAEIAKVNEFTENKQIREIIVKEKQEFLQYLYPQISWRSNVPLTLIESHLKSMLLIF
jgi:hypothetical protein